MDLALFFCSCALLFIGAALVTSAIPLKNRLSLLIGFYVVFWALLVLVGEAAALAGTLNSRGWHLGATVLVASVASGMWFRVRRTARLRLTPDRPWLSGSWRQWAHGGLVALRDDTELAVLGAAVIVLYAMGLYLTLAVPPNSGDAYTTYLARAASWIQSGTLVYPTDQWTQLAYPINQQLGVAWTMLMTRSDQWAGVLQWVAAVVSMLTVYGIGRRLEFGAGPASFSALVWGASPLVLWHSTSTLVDIGVTSFLGASVYFLYVGIQERCHASLWLSGIALGLAFGTKQVPSFLLPGMGATWLLVIVLARQTVGPLMRTWMLAVLVGFASLGVLSYVNNVRLYGNPVAPAERALMNYRGGDVWTQAQTVVVQMVRYSYLLVDVETGMPADRSRPFVQAKATLASALADILHLPVESDVMFHPYFGKRFSFSIDHGFGNEQRGAFGIVFGVLFIPAIVMGVAADIRARHPYKLGVVMMFLSLLVSLSIMRSWSGVEGRYFMPGALLIAPLLGTFYRAGWDGRVFRSFIIAVAIAVALWATLASFMKPLVGNDAIWGLDRVLLRSRFFGGVEPTWYMIDQLVPPDATIACVHCTASSYYLFGERLTRTVHYVADPRTQLKDVEWFEARRVGYLLNCTQRKSPPGFTLIGERPRAPWNPGCRLYKKDDAAASRSAADPL